MILQQLKLEQWTNFYFYFSTEGVEWVGFWFAFMEGSAQKAKTIKRNKKSCGGRGWWGSVSASKLALSQSAQTPPLFWMDDTCMFSRGTRGEQGSCHPPTSYLIWSCLASYESPYALYFCLSLLRNFILLKWSVYAYIYI